MTLAYYILGTLFTIVSILLILIVLIQKGRGGGLSGAFGGGGGSTAFGTKTGDVLTWATSIIFGIFLLLAVFLNLVANRMSGQNKPTPPGQSAPQQPVSPSGPTGPGGEIPIGQ